MDAEGRAMQEQLPRRRMEQLPRTRSYRAFPDDYNLLKNQSETIQDLFLSDQFSRFLKIEGIETFGEPIINFLQHTPRILMLALLLP